ncbi:amidohydrolase [Kribbella sp. NPDC051770]|uniref:amidohydrolase n=1 Tax=Kribbella sp. NPDC051770 TaxID=3155413 RepID=UPI0034294460
MTSTLIRNCAVLVTPDSGDCSVQDAQDIHITDGTISAITPTRQTPPSDAEVLDATGLLAIPGLTNAHTHTPMVLMRGAAEDLSLDNWFNQKIWPMETNLTPERVRIGARLACAEMLLSGITSFADHYFHADQVAQAAAELGIRADLAPTFFTSTGPEAREASFDTARQIRALSNPRITASLGPHAPYTVSEEDLTRTAEVARSENFRIHLHAAETQEQTTSSLTHHNATPIRLLHRTGILEAGAHLAHACALADEDVTLLAQHADRTVIATCPKIYLKLAMGNTTPIRSLQAAGIPISIGTDGAAAHNTQDMWESLRLTALTEKHKEQDATWMSLSQTLRLATHPNTLTPGHPADITLVDLSAPHNQPLHNPLAALVYSIRPADVIHVLVAGHLVVHNQSLTTADLPEILNQANEVADSLVTLTTPDTIQHYAP